MHIIYIYIYSINVYMCKLENDFSVALGASGQHQTKVEQNPKYNTPHALNPGLTPNHKPQLPLETKQWIFGALQAINFISEVDIKFLRPQPQQYNALLPLLPVKQECPGQWQAASKHKRRRQSYSEYNFH